MVNNAVRREEPVSGTRFVDREHPLTEALAAVGLTRDLTVPVVSLKALRNPNKKSAVYRVGVTDPGIRSVVAKRTRLNVMSVEAAVYSQLLAKIRVTQPQFHGCFREQGLDYGWVILEDLDDGAYDSSNAEHRHALATWLANVHAYFPTDETHRKLLPDRGPVHYAAHLESGLTFLSTYGTGLSAREYGIDPGLGERLCTQLDWLRAHWSAATAPCESALTALTHGDLEAKNIRTRRSGRGIQVYPIDWETAGVGPVAPDICKVDVEVYAEALHAIGIPLPLSSLRALARVGTLLRLVASIDWACDTLRSWPSPKASAQLAMYSGMLTSFTGATTGTDWAYE